MCPGSPQGVKGLPPESSYRIKNTGGSWDTHGTGTGHVPAGVGGVFLALSVFGLPTAYMYDVTRKRYMYTRFLTEFLTAVP